MFDFTFFFKGILIGFTIAAPVGPVGILCLKRTLTKGRLAGLASGLGAAVADALYGVIAAFGLTMISDLLFCCVLWFEFAGGLFLLALGIRTFFKPPIDPNDIPSISSYFGYFGSTFLLTLTNPITLLTFLAIFTAIGAVGPDQNPGSAIILVLGVFTGSATWWLLIGEGVSFFRSKISDNILIWVNKVAGSMLTLFGLLVLGNWLYQVV